jgi:hypothetical protein
MSKITLKEFNDFTDLFLTYYQEKGKKREDGWIERTFKKNPKLKDMWKSFDRKIKDAEKQVDAVAKPYMKSQGIDVDKLNK